MFSITVTVFNQLKKEDGVYACQVVQLAGLDGGILLERFRVQTRVRELWSETGVFTMSPVSLVPFY